MNYDSNATCPDNSSCIYCTNDPGIPNAIFSYATNPTNALSVSWAESGTTITNGIATLLNSNSNTLYKIEYQYKLPGSGWTAWQLTSPISSSGSQNISYPNNCGFNNWNNTPYWKVVNSISVFGQDGQDRGVGPNDGRFNQGVKWRFKIKMTIICIKITFF